MNSKHKELSVRQNMIWNMAGSIIGMACQWLISIIVVRLAADMSSAGLYSLAMSVFAIFSPIANFGMYTYIVTDMEDRNTSGEYITISLFTSLAAIIVTTAYAVVTCRPNALPVVFSYALYKGITIIIDIIHAVDQKAHRMDYIGISLGLQGILPLLSFAVVFCNHSKPNRLGIVNGTCNTAHLHRLRPAARQGADPYPTRNLSISSNGHTGKLLIDSPGKHRHWRIRLDTPSISFRNHGGCRSWHLRLRCYSGSHYPSVFNLYLQPAYRLFRRELSLMQSPLFYPLNPLHPHRNHSDWTY